MTVLVQHVSEFLDQWGKDGRGAYLAENRHEGSAMNRRRRLLMATDVRGLVLEIEGLQQVIKDGPPKDYVTDQEGLAALSNGAVIQDEQGVIYVKFKRDPNDRFPWAQAGASVRYSDLAPWLPAEVLRRDS